MGIAGKVHLLLQLDDGDVEVGGVVVVIRMLSFPLRISLIVLSQRCRFKLKKQSLGYRYVRDDSFYSRLRLNDHIVEI